MNWKVCTNLGLTSCCKLYFLTLIITDGSNFGNKWTNVHAPNAQGLRSEVRRFTIQPVSAMVHTISEVCTPRHMLRAERKHMYQHVCMRMCVHAYGKVGVVTVYMCLTVLFVLFCVSV